ncbi:MAG: DMT family transporter [Proteobacteria bacterium]|nr:DMT family transporter [Pseudomonadota bacterium]
MGSRSRVLPVAMLAVLLSFAANSLMTRFVVQQRLLDAALLTEVRFLSGALMLVAIAVVRGVPKAAIPGRRHLVPACWLGAYALLISYGYQHIGASAGTFVFYAAVFIALVGVDTARGATLSTRRLLAALLALAGLGVLAAAQLSTVTPLGVAMLAGTGLAWGLYTAVGRGVTDPLAMTTGNFVTLAVILFVPAVLGVGQVLGTPIITASGLGWGVLMGAGTTACAYPIWYWCLRHISGTQAGLFQLAIPIVTGVGAVGLLGEPFSLRLAVAGLLVVLGLGLGLGR